MDRFIAIAIPSMGEVHPYLKSNMDRFIEFQIHISNSISII